MPKLFNSLKEALLEAIESAKNENEETSLNKRCEDIEPLECGCIADVPEELLPSVQGESEYNMLLDKEEK